MPSIQEQVAFHDQWNASFRDVSFDEIEEESRARGEKVSEWVSNLYGPGSSIPASRPNILEIGCGTRWLTKELTRFGTCSGIDLSPKAIEIARRRVPDAAFIVGDFASIQIEPQSIDLAILVETIAYVEDQLGFLTKIASQLKPDGYLVLTTVNTFVYNRRSDIGPPKPGLLRKWLPKRELAALLRPSFRVLKQTTVLPKGDRGLLRVANAPKVNRVLNRLFGSARTRRWKEWAGLGHTRVVLAQKRR